MSVCTWVFVWRICENLRVYKSVSENVCVIKSLLYKSVREYVCVWIGLFVNKVCAYMSVCVQNSVRVSLSVYTSVCAWVCRWVNKSVCEWVCVWISLYSTSCVWNHLFEYNNSVCMYVFVCKNQWVQVQMCVTIVCVYKSLWISPYETRSVCV